MMVSTGAFYNNKAVTQSMHYKGFLIYLLLYIFGLIFSGIAFFSGIKHDRFKNDFS